MKRLDNLLKNRGAFSDLVKIPSFIEELEGPEWSENEEVNRAYSKAIYDRFNDESCTRLSKTYGWRWLIDIYKA